MSNLFERNEHLTQAALQKLKSGELSEVELIRVTDHIADCKSCASAFVECFSVSEFIDVPYGFAEEVESKLYSRRKSNRQFTFYSIRVAIAACAALVIVFSSTLNFVTNLEVKAVNIRQPDLHFINSINSSLQDLSQTLLNMEVFKNEKEKK